MERLTEKHYLAEDHYMKCSGNCHGDIDCIDCPAFDRLVERLAAYEDTGLMPEQVVNAKTIIESAFADDTSKAERIRKLVAADDEGRVVVLPCRQGDELWTYCNHPVKRVYSFTVSDVSTLNGRTVLNTLGIGTIRPEDIGKTVFFTREEAERAMEGQKHD